MLVQPRKIIPVLLLSILAACGGGGGDTSVASTSQSNSPADSGASNGGANSAGNTVPSSTDGNTTSTPSAPSTTDGSTPTTGGGSQPTTPTTATSNGNYDQTARFAYPGRIARDSAGNVYVEDIATSDSLRWAFTWTGTFIGNERIRKIAPNGDVTTLPGTYERIVGLAASGTNLFVAAMRPNTPTNPGSSMLSATDIIKIAQDGTRTTLATYLVGPGTSDPIALSTDALGHVFVTHHYRLFFTIDRIDPDGTKTVAYKFSTFGDFYHVASDAQGTLTLTLSQPGGAKYLVYVPLSAQSATLSTSPDDASSIPRPPGVIVRETDLGSGDQIAYDAAGNLYIFSISTSTVDPGSSDTPATYKLTGITLRRMAPDGTINTVYNGLPEGITTEFSGYGTGYPRDFAVAPNGDAYLSLSLDHTVYKISVDGKATLVAGKSGEPGTSD